MDNPSIGEANKVLRVLNGVRLKYTVQVHLPNGKIVEFQAAQTPEIRWSEEARCLWLWTHGYQEPPIMAWPEGAIMLCEENPKV